MTKIKLKSQLSFIKEFFSQNPNVDHKTTDIKKITLTKLEKDLKIVTGV